MAARSADRLHSAPFSDGDSNGESVSEDLMNSDGEGDSGVEVGAGGEGPRGPPPAWSECLQSFGPATLREPAACRRPCEEMPACSLSCVRKLLSTCGSAATSSADMMAALFVYEALCPTWALFEASSFCACS